MVKNLSQDVAQSNVTPELFQKYFASIARLESDYDALHEEAKTAKSRIQSEYKAAKKQGIDIDALKMLKRLTRLDNDDAAQQLRYVREYANFMQLPLYTQTDIFARIYDVSPEDQESALSLQAQQEGFNRGTAGDDREDNPFQAGSAQYVAWHDGWATGRQAYDKKHQRRGAPKRITGRRGKGRNPEDRVGA